MTTLFGLLSKLADRPSTVWRLAWLMFCLIVVCLFGPRTLRWITPYVLAGVADTLTAPLLPESRADELGNEGKFATWVLPCISWLVLAGIVAWLLAQ